MPKLLQVQISDELHRRFKEAFPMRGATSWVVRTSMEYLLSELADDPDNALRRGLIRMRQDLTAVAAAATLPVEAGPESGCYSEARSASTDRKEK